MKHVCYLSNSNLYPILKHCIISIVVVVANRSQLHRWRTKVVYPRWRCTKSQEVTTFLREKDKWDVHYIPENITKVVVVLWGSGVCLSLGQSDLFPFQKGYIAYPSVVFCMIFSDFLEFELLTVGLWAGHKRRPDISLNEWMLGGFIGIKLFSAIKEKKVKKSLSKERDLTWCFKTKD